VSIVKLNLRLSSRVNLLSLAIALVHNIIRRGGRVLLPVFALGRAQEILLILDEYWSEHPELHHIPIFFVSSLAIKCMDVYRQ
jgi:cleavage and polyadenylation specificity factor subunit 3